jgi:hypothetical protein
MVACQEISQLIFSESITRLIRLVKNGAKTLSTSFPTDFWPIVELIVKNSDWFDSNTFQARYNKQPHIAVSCLISIFLKVKTNKKW